nr:cytochrome c3 family protein [uncultured Desulfuromonas sp.]
MQKRLFPVYAVMLAALMVLSGCGSNSSSGGSSSIASDSLGTDTTGEAYIGAAACIDCHEGFSWSAAEVTAFLDGKHVSHSDHVDASMAADGCLGCHDPIGDGRSVEDYVDPSIVPENGMAVVTCEACHGAGGDHYGIGPMPQPQPGADVCGQCHSTLPDSHLPHHPNANTIYEGYAASAHAGSAGPGYSEYSTDEDLQNAHMTDHLPFGHNCVKCHTHEGAIKYLEVDNADGIAAIDDGAGNSYTSIQCKTCHDPHEAGKLLEPGVHEEHPIYAEDGVTLIGLENITVSSAQFNTCMNCHDQEGYHLTRNTAWSMLETHFDDETTVDIEGYAIDETSENSCGACHDIHGPKNEINEQWAKSGHAAEIGLVKEELGPDAVISLDDEEERHSVIAFTEINFALTEGRETCQRCHTTTGASNYLGNEENYDAANNDFSYLDPQYDADGNLVSSKIEFLSCETCHTSATTGALRITDTDITLDYTYGGEEIVLSGVNESTTCLTCHGGWGNMDSLVAMDDESRDFHGVLHHGPAGAILFADQTHAAYEFAGQVYSSTSPHKSLGSAEGGPCVACHMPEKNHSNIVADTMTGVVTSGDTCVSCHGGSMTAARLTELNEQRQQAAALIRSYTNNAAETPNALGVGGVGINVWSADASYGRAIHNPSLVPTESFRAFCNWWVIYDDRGAEAHNPTYVKQVAFDTIDYMQDADLDGTITIPNPANWAGAIEWLGGNVSTGVITRP